MMVIWGLVSLFLTAVVRRQRLRSGRTASLYIGFVPSTVVYGGYLWAVIPDGTAWSVFLALVAGQLYGFPLSLAVRGTHPLLSRLVVPRAVGGSR